MLSLSDWVPWIYRGFLIIVSITVLVSVFTSSMEQIGLVVEDGMSDYRRHAAAIAVLDGQGEKGVLDSDQINPIDDGIGCSTWRLDRSEEFYLNSTAKEECHRSFVNTNPGEADPGHFYLDPEGGSKHDRIEMLEVGVRGDS